MPRLRPLPFALITVVCAPALWGCAETLFILGTSGTARSAAVRATNSGGITTVTGQIPIATQPAAIPGPAYSPALLDPLFESTAGAKAVTLGDIDNDGLLDVASISDESQPVQIHLRNATTGLFDTLSVGGASPIARTVAIQLADLNADGRLDIVVLVKDTGFVPPMGSEIESAVVLLLQGADPRNPYLWRRVVPANMRVGEDENGFTDMAVADFDGQLGPDVIVLSNEPMDVRRVYLYPNPGPAQVADEGTTAWVASVLEIDASPLIRCEAGDIDGDGDIDLVMCAPPSKGYNIRWLQNTLAEAGSAASAAGPWVRRIVGQQQDGGQVIAVGDIDGDGAPDVAAARPDLRLVQWFRNPGGANLALETFPIPWEVYNIGVINSGEINQVRLADLDQNGTLDCYLTASGNVVGFQRQSNLFDYWTPFSILSTDPVATIGRTVFTDFNGDGRLDFVAPLDREGLAQDQLVIFARQ